MKIKNNIFSICIIFHNLNVKKKRREDEEDEIKGGKIQAFAICLAIYKRRNSGPDFFIKNF
jgi:hypothetical protein